MLDQKFNFVLQPTLHSGQRAMKSMEWKTYRTRFLIKAKQLNSALSFVDPLGRQHCGRKGDYLVESSEGVISITPRHIFEDIYVPMSEPENELSTANAVAETLNFEDISADTEEIQPPDHCDSVDSMTTQEANLRRALSRHDDPARVRRKLPQPCRDRRPSASRLELI